MMTNILPYATIMFLLPLVDWAFHGPSRIMERQLAFDATRLYKMSLYHMAISLPIERHTDNHTGTTIDKITKATGALERFASWIFSTVGTFISLVGALVALGLILPWLLI
jgi:ABC-type multidrug transport system fused ATPase/permease subunit